MAETATIRDELRQHLIRQNYTLEQFAEISGINRGTLSSILSLHSPRPISVGQLDRITEGMGRVEGDLYDVYVEECMVEFAPHWRRIRPFLLRCAELGKTACIHRVLNQLTDDLSYIPGIFDTAEQMYHGQLYSASAVLYECIAESERYAHSERLATSHYRLFVIACKLQGNAADETIRFMPYRTKLPESYAVDGLLLLCQQFAMTDRWTDVYAIASELEQLAGTMLHNPRERKEFGQTLLQEKELQPLIVYYGQSLFYRGIAAEQQGRLDEARSCIQAYQELSGLGELDECGFQEAQQLVRQAQKHLYMLELRSGNVVLIPEYAEFLAGGQPAELMEGLLLLVQTAIAHRICIDKQLALLLVDMEFGSHSGEGQGLGNLEKAQYARFCYYYGIYLLSSRRYTLGLNYNLLSLRRSLELNQTEQLVLCMALFEEYRSEATEAQREQFELLCKNVLRQTERTIPAALEALA